MHKSDAAAKALSEAAVRDGFWGVRIEAVKTLSALKNDASRGSLIEAVKDKDSRIRREAIKGLAAYKDPKLADLFVKIINTDPSYFAIAEAARALGQSGSPQAYDVLAGALKLESWQGTIRAGVPGGFAALKDPRALEAGLKYATPANPASLRNAAFQILPKPEKETIGRSRRFFLRSRRSRFRFESTLCRACEAWRSAGDPGA